MVLICPKDVHHSHLTLPPPPPLLPLLLLLLIHLPLPLYPPQQQLHHLVQHPIYARLIPHLHIHYLLEYDSRKNPQIRLFKRPWIRPTHIPLPLWGRLKGAPNPYLWGPLRGFLNPPPGGLHCLQLQQDLL